MVIMVAYLKYFQRVLVSVKWWKSYPLQDADLLHPCNVFNSGDLAYQEAQEKQEALFVEASSTGHVEKFGMM